MKITTLIFDLDGTLVDSESVSLTIWKRIGEEYQIDLSDKVVSLWRGSDVLRARSIYESIYPNGPAFQEIRHKHDVYFNILLKEGGIPLNKGADRILSYAKEAGFKIGLATSSDSGYPETILKQYGLYPYFDAFVFGNEVPHGKPEPDIFLKAANALNSKAEECLIFEDSPNGIAAAHAAKIPVIAIENFANLNDIDKKKCSAVLSSLDEAILFLKNMQSK